MKNLTITIAIRLGFDFENQNADSSLTEISKNIIEFLNENLDKLPVKKDFADVGGSGTKQYVNYLDFNSTGEIIDFKPYWYKRKQKIYHSNFLLIDDNGKCFHMQLYCYSK